MQRSTERSCPWLRRRFNLEERGRHPTEDNACALWADVGVPPDVLQAGSGQHPWRGEPYVPISVETQYSVCLTEHYGSCRWLSQRRWHTREVAQLCPYLGSANDRQHKYLFPSQLNVCHGEQKAADVGLGSALRQARRKLSDRGKSAGGQPTGRRQALSAERQRDFCLSERYVNCSIYLETL